MALAFAGSVDSSDFACAMERSATALNAAAHSSGSEVLIEAKASRTSAGSSAMRGYIPFSARLIASAFTSSIVRSRRSCAQAPLAKSAAMAKTTPKTSKQIPRERFNLSSIWLWKLREIGQQNLWTDSHDWRSFDVQYNGESIPR